METHCCVVNEKNSLLQSTIADNKLYELRTRPEDIPFCCTINTAVVPCRLGFSDILRYTADWRPVEPTFEMTCYTARVALCFQRQRAHLIGKPSASFVTSKGSSPCIYGLYTSVYNLRVLLTLGSLLCIYGQREQHRRRMCVLVRWCGNRYARKATHDEQHLLM